MKTKTEVMQLADRWASWLLFAIAAETEDSQFFRGEEEENIIVTDAILINAQHAIIRALEEFCGREIVTNDFDPIFAPQIRRERACKKTGN